MQARRRPQRHAAITALAAFDAPRLPDLIRMRDAMRGRWLVDDTRRPRRGARGGPAAGGDRRARRAGGRLEDGPRAGHQGGEHAGGERVVRHVQRRSPDQGVARRGLAPRVPVHLQPRGLLHLPLRPVPGAGQEVDLGRRRLAGAARPPQRPRRAAALAPAQRDVRGRRRSTSGPATWS